MKKILLLALAALLTVAGVGTLMADDDDNGKHRFRSKGRVIIVNEDGGPHTESFTWNSDNPPAFLGVALESSDDGARITRVVEDSPAEVAGLQEGDIIVSIGGKSIESPSDVTHSVWGAEVGDDVEIEVLRDGRSKRLNAELIAGGFLHGLSHFDTEAFELRMEEMSERLGQMEFNFDSEGFAEHMEELGERMGEMEFNFDFDFDNLGHLGRGRPLLGVELVNVTPELRQHMGARDNEGVLIGRVIEDSAAEAAGLEVGDMIIAVDGESIEDGGDLRHLLHERRGESFGIDIIRDGSPRSLTVVLPDEDDLQERDERRHERRRVRPARQTSLHT